MGIMGLLNLLSSNDGDELYEKLVATLERFGVNVYKADGSAKSMYEVVCEVAEVWKNNTK